MIRAPAFWNDKDHPLSRVLTPASWLWQQATDWRRRQAEPQRTPIPSICVGNVIVGGAGKTPMALLVARLLLEHGARPAFANRGYGAHPPGICVKVERDKHTAAEVGDEALLLAVVAPCYVSPMRLLAAQRAAADGATHIIFDDGLQNPTVAYDSALLVLDGDYGLGNGRIMPAGPLREPLADAAARCQCVIIISHDRHNLAAELPPNLPLLAATLLPDSGGLDKSQRYLAFAGIGRPEKFFDTCRTCGLDLAATIAFPDHHPYTATELVNLAQKSIERQAQLITTAKDAVRLSPAWQERVKVLPITLELENEDKLLKILLPP